MSNMAKGVKNDNKGPKWSKMGQIVEKLSQVWVRPSGGPSEGPSGGPSGGCPGARPGVHPEALPGAVRAD